MCGITSRCALACAQIALAWSWMAALAPAADLPGVELFNRKWTIHDPRSGKGDGLGPMHNASSCVACHNQGGAGGGGDNDHNVDLLSVGIPPSDVSANAGQALIKLHPGFSDEHCRLLPNLVLHRFGPESDYYELRARLLAKAAAQAQLPPKELVAQFAQQRGLKRKKTTQSTTAQDPFERILFKHTQRNTPALWGAGLIDAVPRPVLTDLAKKMNKKYPEISGRVPDGKDGQAGRFGWRGQTPSLRDFVLNACANELGLQTAGHAQAVDPAAPHYNSAEIDMSEADVSALVRFIADLPQPVQQPPKNAYEADFLARGEEKFSAAGCASCHVHTVGQVEGLFSDLLLHDMGEDLADPVGPSAESTTFNGYSGGGTIFRDSEGRSPVVNREWRTPPLWGLASSAPYMHDGRAKTIPIAIEMHGGEADIALDRYRALTLSDRAAVLAFLDSLVAPPLDEQQAAKR